MKITILTLFPELFESFLKTSIIGRVVQEGIVDVECVQIRDFALDKYKHVDDKPFGGGAGMVMKYQPVLDALDSVKKDNSYTLLMSPQGKVYNQNKAKELAQKEHIILLCGHYEGLDARITKHVDEEISIGDYVLTGGELAAMVIMDSLMRLVKGSINAASLEEESFEDGLLEYPQYTQPADYKGDKVPSILLSGHHANIKAYRHKQRLLQTKKKRPDLIAQYTLSIEEKKKLEEEEDEE
ncbi:MAG: tRNA (guanosine(37)-N1)-methyltransferase TrmD [Solobacterium sp.]|nr:tRNA (guanosine(37)-N1)-methyltransferase TrmD [Solobacterium sp.]